MQNLKRASLLFPSILLLSTLLHSTSVAHERQTRVSSSVAEPKPLSKSAEAKRETNLPPLPAGVSDLKFGEFFLNPVGPRGLEFSEKLRSLEGKRIRILGYMVRQDDAPPGRLLLTPRPVQLHDHEYGLCDDLPSSTIHAFVRERNNESVPYTPGLLLLTGTLSLGNREEEDGRISTVRLLLDRPPAAKKKLLRPAKGAQALMSLRETTAPRSASVPPVPTNQPKTNQKL